jgi:hypothetical protein
MTTAERQRKFQKSHPGYDRARKSRGRAGCKRRISMMKAEIRAMVLAERAQAAAAMIQIPAAKPMLMLPAPVENPLMAQIEALAAARKSASAESPSFPAFR